MIVDTLGKAVQLDGSTVEKYCHDTKKKTAIHREGFMKKHPHRLAGLLRPGLHMGQ